MKKRILALLLVLATLSASLPVFVSAVPYSPPANAWKDFGQEHNYIYEVNRGAAAPKIDGYVKEGDGYGEPIATYGFRYLTTAEKYRDDLDQGEYKLKDNGDYYVYPTQDTPDEIWKSISSLETTNTFSYIFTQYVPVTSYTTSAVYFYHEELAKFIRNYKHTKESFNDKSYYAQHSSGAYYLYAVQSFTGQPVDWETNYASYYTRGGSSSGYYYTPVKAVDGKAPAFKASTYYYGERILAPDLYTKPSSGSNNYVARVAWLKQDHTVLPEEVNLYARYDDQYLYYAIEVQEPEHQYVYYNVNNYWGTTMSNSPYVFVTNYDYSSYYRKEVSTANAAPKSNILSSIRTYINSSTALKSTAPILAKFGNPLATYNEVQVSGVDYYITHTPAPKKEEAPATNENESFDDGGFGFDDGMGDGMGLDSAPAEEAKNRCGIKESIQSGTYGKTVYEFRLPWVVLNGKYNPETCTTAVPEMFTVNQHVQLDNLAGRDTHCLSFAMPRYVYNRPGSVSAKEFAIFRYPDRTGLTTGENYGTYNFYWRCVSGVTMWDVEPFLTDYASVSTRKIGTVGALTPVFFTAGQEPKNGYVQPEYAGANIRVDTAEAQKIRIKISVPKTEKEIAQVGAIVAPTEVVRNIQLKLGISSVAYYAYENPVLYGIDNGKWVNLTTNTEKYFATAAMPNDSDSFVSYDELGGKRRGIYTVYTLPVADLENPYESNDDADIYTVVYGGANGEGIYNDFDDFNTFYTIRPYIKYKDGTVTYGEHEYKSIYYIACNLIQPMLEDYNVTYVGTTSIDKKYNMDMMGLTTYTDSEGNVITDKAGNPIYMPTSTSPSSSTYSNYSGAREYSIYLDARRHSLFEWYAVRTVGRRNNNTPLRVDDLATYDANTHLLVEQYIEMYENIWKVILAAEGNRYVVQK